jgi:hypothetical protein
MSDGGKKDYVKPESHPLVGDKPHDESDSRFFESCTSGWGNKGGVCWSGVEPGGECDVGSGD